MGRKGATLTDDMSKGLRHSGTGMCSRTLRFGLTFTRIDAAPNKVVKQWVGKGGDSLRVGFGSIWITDYKRGLLERIPIQQLLTQ